MVVGSNPASDKSKACELPKSFKSSSLDKSRALIFNIWRNTDARKYESTWEYGLLRNIRI